jgi:hypothetical protein
MKGKKKKAGALGALLNDSMGDVELSHDELIGGNKKGQEDDKQSNTIMQ